MWNDQKNVITGFNQEITFYVIPFLEMFFNQKLPEPQSNYDVKTQWFCRREAGTVTSYTMIKIIKIDKFLNTYIFLNIAD